MGMNEFDYDGLVLVHPEYRATPINPDYVQNLASMVDSCKRSGKPVFWEVFDEEYPELELARILSKTIRLPSRVYGVSIQEPVDFMARETGKPHEQIGLAFGGIHARVCVYALADAWCELVRTCYKGNMPSDYKAQRRVKFGHILPEIT